MYLIDQTVANQIAKTTQMKYSLIKSMFSKTEDQADKMEEDLRDQMEQAGIDSLVARVVVAYSPLYLENQAITQMIKQTGQQNLRAMMPEILTIDEMIEVVIKDYPMIEWEQTIRIKRIVSRMQSNLSLLKE